jgi:hypothetical protein
MTLLASCEDCNLYTDRALSSCETGTLKILSCQLPSWERLWAFIG